jgi:hypothetical protein
MAKDWAGGQRSGRTAAMLLQSAIVPDSNFSVGPAKARAHARNNILVDGWASAFAGTTI